MGWWCPQNILCIFFFMVTTPLLQMPCGCTIYISMRLSVVDGYARTLQQQLFGFVDMSIHISLGSNLHSTISKHCLEVKTSQFLVFWEHEIVVFSCWSLILIVLCSCFGFTSVASCVLCLLLSRATLVCALIESHGRIRITCECSLCWFELWRISLVSVWLLQSKTGWPNCIGLFAHDNWAYMGSFMMNMATLLTWTAGQPWSNMSIGVIMKRLTSCIMWQWSSKGMLITQSLQLASSLSLWKQQRCSRFSHRF